MRSYYLEVACLDAYQLTLPKAIKEREEVYYFYANAAPEYYRPMWKRLGEYATHLKSGGKPKDFQHHPIYLTGATTDDAT